jgi:lysophospholipase L1-like esterase
MRTVLALHARHLDRRLARAAANAPATVHAISPPIDSRVLYAEDGFHPSAEGYRRWATHLVDAVMSLLESHR